MNIGFYFNDSGFNELKLENPWNGNNGIGGTQYCFLTLGAALGSFADYHVYFYHYNNNKLPENIIDRKISNYSEIIRFAEEDKIDFLLFKAENNIDLMNAFCRSSLKTIAWAHNYLLSSELEQLKNDFVKCIVFVGKEQYDRYIDHPIIKKSTYIYNIFDGRPFTRRETPEFPAVTYTGSLVKAKGFHILASVWKDVLKRVPTAQLYIIGSGKLYDRGSKLGPLGVASQEYEKELLPYLTDEQGKLLDSVHFCGNMGVDKVNIYNKTTVGVVNPSAKTETFGISAIEMEACGIPIVTRGMNGLFETTINNKTGFLVSNRQQLSDKIVLLLQNKELNEQFSKAAKHFSDTAFVPEKIAQQWVNLFNKLSEGKTPDYQAPTAHYFNNGKWVRIISRKIPFLPPVIDIECSVRKLLH